MQPERRSPARRARGLAAMILVLFPLLSIPVASQSSSGEESRPWYRVEILVFRQPGETGMAAESWDPEPRLNYPDRHRHLVDRALADARLEAFPGSRSDVDSRGEQRLRLPEPRRPETPDLASPTDPLPLGEDIPAPPRATANGDGQSADPTRLTNDQGLAGAPPIDPLRGDARLDADNPDTPLPPPSPFTLLPERFRELDRDAARMRSAGYEILMHRTWAQPVADETGARALILDRAGDPDVRDWPRLQGSITLHLSRYLHVNTRLWLNTEGGYLHPDWRMPEPPRAPPSLNLLLPSLDDWQRAPDDWQPARGELAPALEVTRPDGRLARMQPPAGQAQRDTDTVYPWRHAILLEQSRRMRGGELHYLDHPVLGVLIKMTLLEEPDLRDMYRETLDWAWEDRHNIVITGRQAVTPPQENRP